MSEKVEQPQQEEKKPVDENMGFYFSSSIKIYDPDTKEVLVQKRGDN
jgi:hypothetical protein